MPGPGMILTDENVLLTEILYLALVMQNYIKYIDSYNRRSSDSTKSACVFSSEFAPKAVTCYMSIILCLQSTWLAFPLALETDI